MFFLSHGDSVDFEELNFIKLDNQDLSYFDCTENGKDEQGLQEFIQKEARPYQMANLGITYLVALRNTLVAFITVAMTALPISKMKKEEKIIGVEIKSYPALLLGRLAVDKRFRRKDLGSYLCTWCVGLARELSKQIGCRYVVCHAREAVIPFYVKNHFVVSEAEKGPVKLLYRKTSP